MQSSKQELPPLGKTGAFTSACRAYESSKSRTDRLFDDPYAYIFAGPHGMKYLTDFCKASNLGIEDATRGIRERTQFIDNQLLHCVDSLSLANNSPHKRIQIVMVGCGGDTRAFRLSFPRNQRIDIYEIDLPSVVEYRQRIFAEHEIHCSDNISIHRIGCDLRYKEWTQQLIQQGYDPHVPSIWMLEGILKYFKHGSTLDNLMQCITQIMACNSLVIGDVVNNTHIRLTAKPWKEAFDGGTMVSGIDVPFDFFARFGFEDIAWKQVGYRKEDESKMLTTNPCRGDPLRRWFVFIAKWKQNQKQNGLRAKL